MSAIVVIFLGIVGGGWGVKQVGIDLPLYSGKPLMIAHRGVSDSVPENTFASAQRALELGFTAIEIDIKRSIDNKFYLFHDRGSNRLLGKTISLKDKTLAELQELPLIHRGQPTRYRVPELNAFVKEFSTNLNFYIDVKRHGNNKYHQLAESIAGLLESQGIKDRTFVGSDFLFTAYLEYSYPEIHTVFSGPGNWLIFIYRWIPKDFRPDFIIGYAGEVTEGHLKWLQRKQLTNRRMLYGVNGENYLEVREWGIPILLVDFDPVMIRDLSQ